jgi:hypothetical protein
MNRMNQQMVTQQEAPNKNNENPASDFEVCPACGRTFRHKEFLDHLFASKSCMRAYWQEEERTHAYRVRHRSLNRKKEREALERENQKRIRESPVLA